MRICYGVDGNAGPRPHIFTDSWSGRVNLQSWRCFTLMLLALGRVQWRSYQKNTLTWIYVLFALHASRWRFVHIQAIQIMTCIMSYLLCVVCYCNAILCANASIFYVMSIVIALGLGVHGLLSGLKSIVTAGGHIRAGPIKAPCWLIAITF